MVAAWFRAAIGHDQDVGAGRGASSVITDLLGGQIQLGIETTSVTLGHLHEGKVKALGVATRARLAELPEIPTVIEAGVPDFVASSWSGLMAPAGTPADVVNRLQQETAKALASPVLKERLQAQGAIPSGMSSADFAKFIAAESAKWTKVVKAANAKVD